MKPPNRAPFFACLYPGLCVLARECGYALTIHGSVVTDLDLVAIPWTDEAVAPERLRSVLMDHLGATDYEGLLRKHFAGALEEDDLVRQAMNSEGADDHPHGAPTIKPHGRLSWNLYMDFGAQVDLSIMPRLHSVQKDA